MKILHRGTTLRVYRGLSGLAIACLLTMYGTPSRAASDAAESAPDAAMIAAHAAAKGDGLLEALLTELDRSKAQLKMDQVQAPYYVEYRVNEVEDFGAEAAFGALRENQRIHVRVLRVVVRIGDYKQDSYFGRGQGESSILPLDNDPIALRHQIWLATDDAYKAAGQALAEKQAAMKQFSADPNPVDDFAKAPQMIAVEPTVSLKIDEAAWKKTLEDVTNLYRQYPDVQSVTASARFSAVNEYLVNSEGTVTRCGKTTFSVQLSSSAQAADGMRLSRSPAFMVARQEELPTRDALMGEAKKMLETMVALRQAPIVEEEYRGPVLFAPDAADDIVPSLIGLNVLGQKPQLGKPNRTTGAFATSYKTRVLPNFLSVVDDPTLKEFQWKSSEAQSAEEQKKKVVQMVTDQGKAYGYRVETLGPGNSPRLLYRVYAKDWHEELVRGAVFNELDIRAIRNDLIAVGNDPLVSNRAGGAPTTIISPSLLFGELEVKRADTSKDKLPDYPAPPLKK